MKIVVLDGYTLNPGDLSWAPLQGLGDVTVHDRTPADQTLARAAGAEILLTNKTLLTCPTIKALPSLRYIGVLATGYNVVDHIAAAEAGVVVTNVPAYSTMSVAQVAFAHILNLTHGMGHHTSEVREGRWSSCADFSFADTPLVELAGKTLGIIGPGRIGAAVARMGLAFGMEVIAYSRSGRVPMPEMKPVSLDDAFARSDVLSFHCPLTPETKHIANAERLAMMKPTAFLINTSRGPLVDERALAAALNAGEIAGAGLDVLSEEPPPPGNPLLTARNCHITPHFAWASTAARERLMHEVTENVRAFIAGTPRNVIPG
ncbi:MAG: D-2-hydroxyacid dehydrogenase [Ignavibacteriae bacterium]|nr:D-2-hydroxyacid dehydrogenase [Ignavibacteriota bacterium]